jgi:hypothetical protein
VHWLQTATLAMADLNRLEQVVHAVAPYSIASAVNKTEPPLLLTFGIQR